MTDAIITSNSKNIGYHVIKSAVVAVERKSKVVYKLIEEKLCGPLLKEHQIFKDYRKSYIGVSNRQFFIFCIQFYLGNLANLIYLYKHLIVNT